MTHRPEAPVAVVSSYLTEERLEVHAQPVRDHAVLRIEFVGPRKHFVHRELPGKLRGRRCSLEAPMVKYVASEMAERVTSEAVQIHGGAGYTTDFAVERH